MFYIIIIFALVTFIIVMAIASEHKKTTFVNTVGLVTIDIYKWIKSLMPSSDICYPTGIGYDVNGCFCPGAVEKEFAELNEILDGLFLENHTFENDVFHYTFKFARVKNDIEGLELYDYLDKKVLAIVQRYLHRIGNNRATDNISSISFENTELMVNLARNSNGEEMNNNWRCRQRYAYNEKNTITNRDRGPIEISWENA